MNIYNAGNFTMIFAEWTDFLPCVEKEDFNVF